MARVFVGDINTKIKLDAGMEISSAIKVEIHYRKPNTETGIWPGIVENSNYVYYLTKSGDLDANGVWEVQIYAEFGNWKGHGEISTFNVYEVLS